MATGKHDIGLIFGVEGEGSINAGSGKLIKEQLESIVNSITQSGTLKVGVQIDADKTKTAFVRQLNKLLSSTTSEREFKIKVSDIDATSAITKFKNQLQSMLQTLKIDTGFNVTVGDRGATSAVREISRGAREAASSLLEVDARLKEISITGRTLTAEYTKVWQTLDKLSVSDSFEVSEESIYRAKTLSELYVEMDTAAKNLQANRATASQEEIQAVTELQNKFREVLNTQRLYIEASKSDKSTGLKSQFATLQQVETLYRQIDSYLSRSTAAATTEQYRALRQKRDELAGAIVEARQLGHEFTTLGNVDLSRTRQEFAGLRTEIELAGNGGRSLGDAMAGAYRKFGGWMFITRSLMGINRQFREMVGHVVAIDTAMTELRKVTEETEAVYARFLDDAARRAVALGATVSDTVRATADFARLGYNIADASMLADAALVYKNVGDGIRDINVASSSIISTMKAFRIEAQDAMRIVDRFNMVGNNFAISSAGIGEALIRSASALAAANNTIDESIGLIVAANNVIQQPEVVGTAIRTISMRLRNTAGELEELGEDAEGAAESITRLQTQLLNLTDGRVDIMLDDETFKSTFQILSELAEIWEDLSDVVQADVIRLTAGIRQGNVFTALMTNMAEGIEATTASLNSYGSAMAELEVFMDSIEGRLSVFRATFQGMAMDFISTDLVKGVVDFGTAILNLIGRLGGLQNVLMAAIGVFVLLRPHLAIQPFLALARAITQLIPGTLAYAAAKEKLNAAMAKSAVSAGTLSATLATLSKFIAPLLIVLAAFGVAQGARQRAEEESRRRAEESARALQEENRALEETRDRVVELRSALDDGNLSHADAYNARRELMSIQNDIISKYDTEAGAINLVTGAIESQIEAIDNLRRTNWEQWEFRERQAIQRAREAFEQPQASVINRGAFSGTRLLDLLPPELRDDFSDMRHRRVGGDVWSWWVTDIDTGTIEGNIELLYRYAEAIRSLNDYDENNPSRRYNAILNAVAEEIGRLEELLNNSRDAEIYRQYIEGLIRFDERYSAAYADILEKRRALNDAYISDNQEQIEQATRNLVQSMENAFERAGDNLSAANAFERMFPDRQRLENALRDFDFEISLSINENDLQGRVSEALSHLEGMDDLAILNVRVDGTPEAIAGLEMLEVIAGEYGFTIEELIALLVRLGQVQGQPIQQVSRGLLSMSGRTAELKSELRELQSAYDVVTRAIEEYNETQTVSLDTVLRLLDIGAEYLQYLFDENGNLVLNEEAFRNLAIAKLEDLRASKQIEMFSLINKLEEEYGTVENVRDAWIEAAAAKRVYVEGGIDIGEWSEAPQVQELLNQIRLIEESILGLRNGTSRLGTQSSRSAASRAVEPLEVIISATRLLEAELQKVNELLTVNDRLFNSTRNRDEQAELLRERIRLLEQQQSLLHQINNANRAEIASNISRLTEFGINVRFEQDDNLLRFEQTAEEIQHILNNIRVGDVESTNAVKRELEQMLDSMIGLNELNDRNGSQWLEIRNTIRQVQSDLDNLNLNFLRDFYGSQITRLDLRLQLLDDDDFAGRIDLINEKIQGQQFIIAATAQRLEEYRQQILAGAENVDALRIEMAETEKELLRSKITLQEFGQELVDVNRAAHENEIKAYADSIADLRFELEQLGDNDFHGRLVINNKILAEQNGIIEANREELARLVRMYNDGLIASDAFRAETEKLHREFQDATLTAQQYARSISDIVAAQRQAQWDEAINKLNQLQSVYRTLTDAAQEFADSGFITVDTFQRIINLGTEYLAYLVDENGQLVINEEAIKRVIAVKTEQAAVETALNYVHALGTALKEGDTEALNRLIDATQHAAKSTWDLVYAQLAMLDLDDKQFRMALERINTLRSLSETAITSIGRATNTIRDAAEEAARQAEQAAREAQRTLMETLRGQESALNDLLRFVMDMIRWETRQRIDGLREQVRQYRNIVNLQKESLRLAREKDNYDRDVANRVRDIASLQTRIEQLALDDSREANAERQRLEEELARLQQQLADTQSRHAFDTHVRTLDRMADAFADQKEEEVRVLEDSISSQEKLYRLAIDRISNHWDTLFQDLLHWNYTAGNSLESELVAAWDSASAAVQRYGGFLEAILQTQNQIAMLNASMTQSSSSLSSGTAGTGGTHGTPPPASNPTVIGNTGQFDTSGAETGRMISDLIRQMRANGQRWFNASIQTPPDQSTMNNMSNANVGISRELSRLLGRLVIRDDASGVWHLDSTGGPRLYEEYDSGRLLRRLATFHTGGIAGDRPTMKDNEVLALLEKGEAILDEPKKQGVYKLVDFASVLSERLGTSVDVGRLGAMPAIRNDVIPSISSLPDRVGAAGDFVFSPEISVTVEHNGSMNDEDANRYGSIAANCALSRLSDALHQRGIGGAGSAALKPQ